MARTISRSAGKKRLGTVLTRMVEPRRAHWGEQLAWVAKAMRGTEAAQDGAGRGGAVPAGAGRGRRKAHAPDAWIDLALVARAFLDGTPIEAIPLAAEIARRTIAANRHW